MMYINEILHSAVSQDILQYLFMMFFSDSYVFVPQ